MKFSVYLNLLSQKLLNFVLGCCLKECEIIFPHSRASERSKETNKKKNGKSRGKRENFQCFQNMLQLCRGETLKTLNGQHHEIHF